MQLLIAVWVFIISYEFVTKKSKTYFEKSLSLNSSNKRTMAGYGALLLDLHEFTKAFKFIADGEGVIKFTKTNFKII